MRKRQISAAAAAVLFAAGLIFLNQLQTGPAPSSTPTPHKPAAQGGSFQSASIAVSYRSLQELTASADLIAEVEITGTRSKGSSDHFLGYTAAAVDVTEVNSNVQEIVIYGASPPQEQEGVWSEDRVSFEIGAKHFLFLKKGKDPSNNSLYRVSGVYQGIFNVENGTVNALDSGYGAELAAAADESSDPASAAGENYMPGESVADFTAKIRRIQEGLNKQAAFTPDTTLQKG